MWEDQWTSFRQYDAYGIRYELVSQTFIVTQVMIKVFFYNIITKGGEHMLMNLFIFWILSSMFFGSREAGRAVSSIFGVLAFIWVMRMLFGFGLALLPFILLAFVFSKIVVPFVVTFLRHFQ